MELLPVKSSTIDAAGYDPETQVMRVRFNSLAEYTYQGVPQTVYDEFLRAESHGSYFMKFIRACYDCKCVVQRPKQEKPDAPQAEEAAKPAKTRKRIS